jgi:uncharacterized protein (DUF488 family)
MDRGVVIYECELPVIYTIGHSNRPLQGFLTLLTHHRVEALVDIRRLPRSRHVPWTSLEKLPAELGSAGIRYHHLPALGGLRRPDPSSANTGWRNAGFRGYADYMATSAFRGGLRELEGLARQRTTAIMCAEAVPWSCHRSLVADALHVDGWRVLHIVGEGAPRPHRPTPFMVVSGEGLLYPGSAA